MCYESSLDNECNRYKLLIEQNGHFGFDKLDTSF